MLPMKLPLFLLLVTATASMPLAQAAERLRVQVPASGEQRVQALLESLADAIDKEDHKAYSECFTKKARSRYCEKAALDFVDHDMSMELGRWVLLEDKDDRATFVLKYTLSRDAAQTEYVSKVTAIQSDGRFLINDEDIQSSRRIGGFASSDKDANDRQIVCRDGKCELQNAAPQAKRVIPSLFNDRDGNPDPNGIMWLDPTKMFGEECAPCNRKAR
jgi:hypothetical protein